jgi:putative acetyltransferase
MEPIAFRPYREADRARVARLWFESSLTSIPGEPVPPDLSVRLFARIPVELAAGWTLTLATAGEEIVGMLAYFPGKGRLHQLFIDPACQGRGIGKALLDEAKGAMARGFWLTTMPRNIRARRFYEREGLRHKSDGPHPEHPESTVSTYAWEPG